MLFHKAIPQLSEIHTLHFLSSGNGRQLNYLWYPQLSTCIQEIFNISPAFGHAKFRLQKQEKKIHYDKRSQYIHSVNKFIFFVTVLMNHFHYISPDNKAYNSIQPFFFFLSPQLHKKIQIQSQYESCGYYVLLFSKVINAFKSLLTYLQLVRF